MPLFVKAHKTHDKTTRFSGDWQCQLPPVALYWFNVDRWILQHDCEMWGGGLHELCACIGKNASACGERLATTTASGERLYRQECISVWRALDDSRARGKASSQAAYQDKGVGG